MPPPLLSATTMRSGAVVTALALRLLRWYKTAVSPMLPPACRYTPTCSEYATEAIERYGLLRGGFISTRRLLSCHPFARGGYDPVPGREGRSV